MNASLDRPASHVCQGEYEEQNAYDELERRHLRRVPEDRVRDKRRHPGKPDK